MYVHKIKYSQGKFSNNMLKYSLDVNIFPSHLHSCLVSSVQYSMHECCRAPAEAGITLARRWPQITCQRCAYTWLTALLTTSHFFAVHLET